MLCFINVFPFQILRPNSRDLTGRKMLFPLKNSSKMNPSLQNQIHCLILSFLNLIYFCRAERLLKF